MDSFPSIALLAVSMVIKMLNKDNVDLNNLEPNIKDPLFGWVDKTTLKNYRLIEGDGYYLSSPLVRELVKEVQPWPING